MASRYTIKLTITNGSADLNRQDDLDKTLEIMLSTSTFIRGVDADTPSIGTNGNWFIGTKDTGVKAQGEQGFTPNVGYNGNWFIHGIDTNYPSRGSDGVGIPAGGTQGQVLAKKSNSNLDAEWITIQPPASIQPDFSQTDPVKPDYIKNKPSINGVSLVGNKKSEDLHIITDTMDDILVQNTDKMVAYESVRDGSGNIITDTYQKKAKINGRSIQEENTAASLGLIDSDAGTVVNYNL